MVDNTKVWLDSVTGPRNVKTFGMSSGLGATVADLPTDDVPAGSAAIDYTTRTLYYYDGASWRNVGTAGGGGGTGGGGSAVDYPWAEGVKF